MNDDEVRALRDGLRILGRRPSDANIDRMAREVLRRGEVIATYRRLVGLLPPETLRALSVGERATLEGDE